MTARPDNPKEAAGAAKVDLSLVPAAAMIHTAHAMMDGAEKYGPYNWRETRVRALDYVAAARRHIAAWVDGQDLDPSSGVLHLGAAIADLAIVIDAIEAGALLDNRPVKGGAGALLDRLQRQIAARRQGREFETAIADSDPSPADPAAQLFAAAARVNGGRRGMAERMADPIVKSARLQKR